MLTARNIAAALGVNTGRIYRALGHPFALPHVLSPAPAQGGRRERRYSIGTVLPRLKAHFELTPEVLRALLERGGYVNAARH